MSRRPGHSDPNRDRLISILEFGAWTVTFRQCLFWSPPAVFNRESDKADRNVKPKHAA